MCPGDGGPGSGHSGPHPARQPAGAESGAGLVICFLSFAVREAWGGQTGPSGFPGPRNSPQANAINSHHASCPLRAEGGRVISEEQLC